MSTDFYCPACWTPTEDGKRLHPRLELGEHEGFGDYYPAYCRGCNTTYEIPAVTVESDG